MLLLYKYICPNIIFFYNCNLVCICKQFRIFYYMSDNCIHIIVNVFYTLQALFTNHCTSLLKRWVLVNLIHCYSQNQNRKLYKIIELNSELRTQNYI